jgi:hypothetical protein
MLNDLGRSSLGVNSHGRSSIARFNKVIDLDLNSIEFNTPTRGQEVEIEYFQPTGEVSSITDSPPVRTQVSAKKVPEQKTNRMEIPKLKHPDKHKKINYRAFVRPNL